MFLFSDFLFWQSFRHSILTFPSGIYSDNLFGILPGICSDIFSGTLSGILCDTLSGIICICHIFWHSFWHSIWYIFGDSLWLRSSGEHFDPELAVEVRRGTLWSGACGGGPAGITLIRRLLFGSGGEHCNCDLEIAAEVRRGSLWSRGCCSGLEGNTAI